MRCAAGAGLLVLVGCNQVFGIHKTEPYDAAPDVIADQTYVKLTAQVATVLPSGAPDLGTVDVPLDPAPVVRFAALDQPWTTASYGADGTVIVARELFQPPSGAVATWRFEYTLSDGVPHEVQWAPEDKHAQLAVPVFGRTAREAAPANGGYDVAPVGVNPLQSPRVFTTGLWTEGLARTHDASSITYSFGSAVSMSGPRGRPDPAQGDHAFVIDYGVDAKACRYATGSAVLASAALDAAGHSTPAATWDASTRAVTSGTVELFGDDLARFGATIDVLGGSPVAGSFSFGYAPNTTMPGLPGVPRSSALQVSTVLPAPVMITILQCPYLPASAAPFDRVAAQPAALDPFSRLMYVELYATRTVDSVALISGIESATLGATFQGFQPTFPAAIPVAVQLETPGGMVDLIHSAEGVAVGAPARFTVHITPEAAAGLRADYYDVTLHRFAAGGLTTERIYTVISPEVVIDAASLAPGADYVLEIRSFRGHPNAAHGDFRQVEYPYGSAILVTRKFHTA